VTFTGHDALMVGLVLTAMISLLVAAGKLSVYYGIAPETKRKIVHVLTGLISLSFPWLFSSPLPILVMIFVALVTMATLRSPLANNTAMSSVLHDVQRRSYGEFYILISIGFLSLSSGNPVLYVLPLTVIALSDTASALIGTKYGKKRLMVFEGEKTIEGSAAFFIVTLLISLILLMLLTEIADINLLLLSLIVAVFCTFIESDSWKGLDNLFVPVGAHIMLVQLFNATPDMLVLAFILIVTAIILMHKSAPALNLTTRTARAYTLLIILFVVVRPNAQLVFPFMALAAYLLSHRVKPNPVSNGHFEMIAATAVVAMLWMFADVLVPESAIDLFNLTFASVAVVIAGVSFSRTWRWLTLPFAVFIAGIYVYMTSFNLNGTMWVKNPAILAGIAMGLMLISVFAKPDLFTHYRSVKSYALALITPVACFIYTGILT